MDTLFFQTKELEYELPVSFLLLTKDGIKSIPLNTYAEDGSLLTRVKRLKLAGFEQLDKELIQNQVLD